MRLAAALSLALVSVLTAGCTIEPTAEEWASADYGVAPVSSEVEPALRERIASVLKDPDSAKYTFATPAAGWWSVNQSRPLFGYICLVGVNAKNSYGGYTGEQPYIACVRNGVVFHISWYRTGRYGEPRAERGFYWGRR